MYVDRETSVHILYIDLLLGTVQYDDVTYEDILVFQHFSRVLLLEKLHCICSYNLHALLITDEVH